VTSKEGDSSGIFIPLKIAMVVPPWYELPPSGYGGIELICAALVDGLHARGHDVTVFGAGARTGTAARFVSTLGEPQYPRLGEGMPDALVALDTRPEQCLVPRHMGLERQRAALLPSGLDSDTGEA